MPTKTEETRPGTLYIGDEMSPLPTTFEEFPSHLYTLADRQEHLGRESCVEQGGWRRFAILDALAYAVNKLTARPRRKRMSRKRFVKLLMSKGVQRNHANETARGQELHTPDGYADLYPLAELLYRITGVIHENHHQS